MRAKPGMPDPTTPPLTADGKAQAIMAAATSVGHRPAQNAVRAVKSVLPIPLYDSNGGPIFFPAAAAAE